MAAPTLRLTRLEQQTSWTGPDPSPAKRMLLVCDTASVHTADELMEKSGIILMFLPTNITLWLQPLHRVLCGLIKTVQPERRCSPFFGGKNRGELICFVIISGGA